MGITSSNNNLYKISNADTNNFNSLSCPRRDMEKIKENQNKKRRSSKA